MRPWVIHAAWSCGIELWTRPGCDRPVTTAAPPRQAGACVLVRIWLLRHPVTRGLEADHPGRRWHLRRGQRRTALFGERAGVIAGAPDLDHPRAGVVDAGDPAQAARRQLVPGVGVSDGGRELLPAEGLIPLELDKRAERHPSPPSSRHCRQGNATRRVS